MKYSLYKSGICDRENVSSIKISSTDYEISSKHLFRRHFQKLEKFPRINFGVMVTRHLRVAQDPHLSFPCHVPPEIFPARVPSKVLVFSIVYDPPPHHVITSIVIVHLWK